MSTKTQAHVATPPSDRAVAIARHETSKTDSVVGHHVQKLIDEYEARIAELEPHKGKHAGGR